MIQTHEHIGGFLNHAQVVEFDLDAQQFVDHGQSVWNATTDPIYGWNSYYAQIDHSVYMISGGDTGDALSVYDMDNNAFTSRWKVQNCKRFPVFQPKVQR